MQAPLTAADVREANIRYHDIAADSYDGKWGIDFGELGRRQVRLKLDKALAAHAAPPFQRSLEIGAGTGYFTLNLLQDGLVREAVCSDISAGMVRALQANARRLGLRLEAVVAEAGRLPFPEASFDLVLGHAVLHHLPDLDAAWREFHRVLRPGGVVAFAGEPSRCGHQLAWLPKRAGHLLAPLWRRLIGAGQLLDGNAHHAHHAGDGHRHDADRDRLERLVDIHTFAPADLARGARRAGFLDVRVRGEELLASWLGWTTRALESTAVPAEIPLAWRRLACNGYLALQSLDRRLLEPRLPAGIFYNLIVSGRRPA